MGYANHALSIKNVTHTRCGLKIKDHIGLKMAGSLEYVTCQSCLVNMRHEEKKKDKASNLLMRLLGLINIYVDAGVLKEEFEAFTGYEEPITTIEELIEQMEIEMSYWEPEGEEVEC